MGRGRTLSYAIAAGALVSVLCAIVSADDRDLVADRVRRLTRESRWTLLRTVPVTFRTFHPQGMVKIGDTLYVSSVEVKTATKRYPSPIDGYDRDAGEGVGHLFKIDGTGSLIGHLALADGDVYHPGGIDYDGEFIWVPLSEYRPDSHSIVYKVDPRTMTATEVFRYPDSIGAIVHNTDDGTLHGVSWGSRRFYRWTLDAAGRVTNATVPRDRLQTLNPSHYVDYQDCKYVRARRMLCTGLSELRASSADRAFRLGGLDLISLDDGRPLHQVPVPLWTAGGLDMTHNPAWLEPSEAGLRAYFMPEDDQSTLYVYDVAAR
jgi:hypothetical protein